MYSTLEEKINDLWAGFIKDLKIDICRQKILIDTYAIDEGEKTSYKVEMAEVSSYLFYNNSALEHKDYDYEKWDTAEVTSFYYLGAKKDVFSIKSKIIDPPRDMTISYNLFMEIWSSELYVRANKLKINDDLFDLNTGKLII